MPSAATRRATQPQIQIHLTSITIGTGFAGYLYPASCVFTTGRAFWPKSFIATAFDDDLKAAGNKTTTLELIGWL